GAEPHALRPARRVGPARHRPGRAGGLRILGDQLPVLGLGLFHGLALCLFVLALPPLRRPTLSSRISPYLRDQESLVDVYAPPTPRSQGFVGLTKSALLTSTL